MNRLTVRNCTKALRNAGLGLLAALASTSALAEPGPHAYRMMVIEDQALGRALLRGHYQDAIDELTAMTDRRYGFSRSNNLCVAYVNAGKPAEALGACDTAVRRSKLKHRRDHAVALSNFGVVQALTGDITGAMESFWNATRLNPDLRAAVENFAQLTVRLKDLNAAR